MNRVFKKDSNAGQTTYKGSTRLPDLPGLESTLATASENLDTTLTWKALKLTSGTVPQTQDFSYDTSWHFCAKPEVESQYLRWLS